MCVYFAQKVRLSRLQSGQQLLLLVEETVYRFPHRQDWTRENINKQPLGMKRRQILSYVKSADIKQRGLVG